MSADEVTNLPEVVPREDEEKQIDSKAQEKYEKQVAGADGKQVKEDWAYGLPSSNARAPFWDRIELHRSKYRRKLLWMGMAATLLIVGLALGVGLGVGLRSNQHGTSSSKHDSAFMSTHGAFNGTSIVLRTGADYSPGEENALTLFYQHFSGEIRRMHLSASDLSSQPISEPLVARVAKNGTPISAMATVTNEHHYQHVFYVGTDNKIKERLSDNLTAVWYNGALTKQDITTITSDNIGLHAAFYDGPILNLDTAPTEDDKGGRIWIPTSEATFDQWAWRLGRAKWKWEQSWQGKNAHVAPATNDRTKGETTYVMFVDQQDKPELWWQDVANDTESTNNHPINKWRKGPSRADVVIVDIDLPKARSTTSLFRAGNWYAQNADSGDLHGWNISLAAENSTIVPSLFPTLDANLCIPNSNIDAAAIPVKGPPDTIYVACQTRGDDITVYTSTPNSDSWTKAVLIIPNE